MLERAHYVINYNPDHELTWFVVDLKHDVIVDRFAEFDDAVVRVRALRGELAMGDLT